MSMDYRQCMRDKRTNVDKITFSYKNHCTKSVLKQLKAFLKNTEEINFYENMQMDMLWIIKSREKIEKGIYSWNTPKNDLAIVAKPTLMAVIMGEYNLAVKLMEKDYLSTLSDSAEEFVLENNKVCIGGGNYSFSEACLMSFEMPLSVKKYFLEKGFYGEAGSWMKENFLLEEMQFYRDEIFWYEDIWRLFQEIKALYEKNNKAGKLLKLAIEFALRNKIDKKCDEFWDKLFRMFSDKEERYIIIETLHGYFVSFTSAEKLSPVFEERILKGVKVYFQYASDILMAGAVKKYVLERIYSKTYRNGAREEYLMLYFDIVREFEGAVCEEWKNGMFEVLSRYEKNFIDKGFKNGFLKGGYIAEGYAGYLISKRIMRKEAV